VLAAGLARALVMGTLAMLALTHTIQLWHLFAGSVAWNCLSGALAD
jgi:hypothetical protein